MGVQNVCLLLKLIHRLHFPQHSAWARWVRQRACIANLKGDLHGEHWEVLRSILPLYQAITTVQIGDGACTSFWMDVWLGDEALAEVYPALYSHCTCKDVTVREVLDTGIQTIFVPRLTTLALEQLRRVETNLSEVTLSEDQDSRLSHFSTGEASLDSGGV